MSYIFPPRPKGRITPGQLSVYENSKQWIVQRKFKGTRNLIHISPKGDVSFFGRHNAPHKQFKANSDLINQVLSLNLMPNCEYWLDSELLHSKTASPYYKNRIVLFDILQEGRYFLGGPNQLERLNILNRICRNPQQLEPNGIALRVSENIWMAETFSSNFTQRFKELIHLDEIEGLVLRKRNSVIDNMGHKEYEIGWQIRCRKPEKSYNF